MTCAGCGKQRGFFGVFTWERCRECGSQFCPDCYGQLADVASQQAESEIPAQECSNCGAAIVMRAAIPDGFGGHGP